MSRKKFYDEHGNEVNAVEKKPFYKKWWFWLIIVFLFLGGIFGGDEEADKSNENVETEAETAQVANVEETANNEADEKAENEQKEKEKAEAQAKAEEDAKRKEEEEEEAAAAVAEAEEAIKAEEQDRTTYKSDLTYDNLARTPDDYLMEKIMINGSVAQVMEGDGFTSLRVAKNDDYDQMILVQYSEGAAETRILEDDTVDIYGYSMGLYTYESTLGGEITIPSLQANIVDLK